MDWLTIQVGKFNESNMPDRFVCSGCMKDFPIKDIHVLAWWNDTAEAFFTTYRCSKCWPQSLAETRAKLKDPSADVKEAFITFLRNYKLKKLARTYALAAPVEADKIAAHFVDVLEKNPLLLFMNPDNLAEFFHPSR